MGIIPGTLEAHILAIGILMVAMHELIKRISSPFDKEIERLMLLKRS